MATKIFGIRMTEEDKKNLDRQAAKNGMTASEYVRTLTRLKVSLKTVIKEMRQINR